MNDESIKGTWFFYDPNDGALDVCCEIRRSIPGEDVYEVEAHYLNRQGNFFRVELIDGTEAALRYWGYLKSHWEGIVGL